MAIVGCPRALVSAITIVTLAGLPFGAMAAGDPLQAVFARIDQASLSFKWMTAKVQKTEYVAVVDETSTESGKIRVVKPKPHDLRIRIDFEPPDEKQVAIDPSRALMYYPKTNEIQEVIIGKQTKPVMEQLFLLGFGATSQDIQSGYTVRFVGAETASGQPAARIELTPRDKAMQQHFRKIELWISDATGLAVQQKFYEPGKNYNLAVFTDIDLNTRVTEADVRLNPPKSAKKDVPIGKKH
ncbi:MAG TPA: outer membrane lipoprotein carrier protein LolA [Verrucomicrobiae bacterium]|nr:outer membrane lipoprotein carrier protein LolA [Verrucomicrobiae bacterium]